MLVSLIRWTQVIGGGMGDGNKSMIHCVFPYYGNIKLILYKICSLSFPQLLICIKARGGNVISMYLFNHIALSSA